MSKGYFAVRFEQCDQCLFSKDKIVSTKRRQELLRTCKDQDCHFICHKSTINGEEVCCRAFYDANPCATNLMRIAERLGVVKFTDDHAEPAGVVR